MIHRTFVVLVAGLTACASIPSHQVDMLAARWVGTSYDSLLQTWGAPTSFRRGPEGIEAVWQDKEEDAEQADTSVSVGLGAGSYGRHGGVGVGLSFSKWLAEPDVCLRKVHATTEGIVDQVSWRGDRDLCAKLLGDKGVEP